MLHSKLLDFIRKQFSDNFGFIPLHEPIFDGNEKKYLSDCIDSTFVSSVGKFVDEFESEISKFTGSPYAVACVNGTAALHVALTLFGVEENDEVITQPLTFIATANAIRYCGAKPIFVDISNENLGLCPNKLKSYLALNTEWDGLNVINKKTGAKIKAVVPMHTFGLACDIEEIKEICSAYNLTLIEDAAEALGSYYKEKHLGTFGDAGIISFNGNKTITTGGGGAILFKDKNLADSCRHLITQAKIPHKYEYEHDRVGFNYRMPNLNAALGLAQLENIESILKSKRLLANAYKNFLKDSNVKFVVEKKNSKSNYWFSTILFENAYDRTDFLELAYEKNVMCRPVWKSINENEMYKNHEIFELKNSNDLINRLVNIPSGPKNNFYGKG